MNICFIIGSFLLLYLFYRLYQYFFLASNINSKGKYVLISGCDTGFGNGLAIELDKKGFNVLAGVLLSNNIISLKNKLSPNATVFQLDITQQEDIDAAYDLVKNKTNSLHALVNNAGIGIGGNIDWTSMEVMRKVMDVNFFGHVSMTKKFLSLLIAKRDSRVINVCSNAGYFAFPCLSAYCASKYVFESFSDCLRREMFPWGLRVSIIEPGYMRTPIIDAANRPFSDFWATLSSDVQERWGENFLKEYYDVTRKNILIQYAENPMKVIRTLEHAVMSPEPSIRYRPGLQSSLMFFPVFLLPAWTIDWLLNISFRLYYSPASVSKQLRD